MADDPGMVRFMTEVISGQVAANNRNFHPDADPLPKPAATQAPPSISTPPPVAPPSVFKVSAPVAPLPAKSSNPLWWIVGTVAAFAAVVLVVRRKKPKD